MKKMTILTGFLLLFSGCTHTATSTPTTLDGQRFDLDQSIQGKTTILNFWASWCPFCAVELPAFQALHEQRPEIMVIGINLQEDPETVQQYWKQGGYSFQAVLDPGAQLKKRFNIATQPVTIVIDAAGEVRERRDGPMSEQEIFNLAQYIDPKPTKRRTSEESTKFTDDPIEEAIEKQLASPRSSPTPDFLRRWSQKYGSHTKHSIDFADLLSGGVAKDGIPAIDQPKFTTMDEASSFLSSTSIGTVFMGPETTRFYPFSILNWHEIVNDTVDGQPVMITYCPLCDSAAVYHRGNTTFGVSGFLRESNLVMYDRATESLWNQITGKAIVGEQTGEVLELLPSNVMQFATVQEHHPHAEVLSTDTGYQRDYHLTPYETYFESSTLMFPVHKEDSRLSNKERVLGIVVENVAKAYPTALIQGNEINDTIAGQSLRITWENGKVVFVINNKRHEPVHAFWFSWVAQYPDTQVYSP